MNSKTAILVFAHSAHFEATQKPIQAGEKLFDALNRRMFRVVAKTGLPFFVSSEKNQVGNSFGTRLVHAVESVYESGFERVIVVGNDTPHLQARHLIAAANALDVYDVVQGPSKDGGTYLMGLKKDCFYSKQFEKLAWQTAYLRQSLLQKISQYGWSVKCLESLYDIDTSADIKRVFNSFKILSKALKTLLDTLIGLIKQVFNQITYRFENNAPLIPFNKGSPSGF